MNFNIFKRKKDKQSISNMNMYNMYRKPPFNLSVSMTRDGNYQIEFKDKYANIRQFYDVTRLIVNKRPVNINGHNLYDCNISWYGSNDATILGPTNKSMGRRDDYKNILTEIDFRKLQTDSNYCQFVMKNLLNRNRVTKYLEQGLENNPQRPCGNYIGGVRTIGGRLEKFFAANVGLSCHNSPTMIAKRRAYQRRQQAQKNKIIKGKYEQIRKLNREIDDLSR